MRVLDQTLPTLDENVIFDETLLNAADEAESPTETLRVWESPQPGVVVGRSSRIEEEVDVDFCRERNIPIVRRCSGGAAVVVGPGCLMYSVILTYSARPHLRLIDEAHRFVLGTMAAAIRSIGFPVEHRGISDLVLGDRKVSGNSLRCKRQTLLYHGTLLVDFPLDLLAQCLRTAPRQPDYRAGRGHGEFVTNLPAKPAELTRAIIEAWRAR